MLNSQMHALRLNNMTPAHKSTFNALSSTGKTIATVAAALGITQDDAEKRLGSVVDEALAVRTVGTRATAIYTAA
jgi:hypothetical protein